MRVLVFGRTGQVAQELARAIPDAWDARFLRRDDANLESPASCAALIERADVDAVINAAAYTAVDKAENEESLATRINGETPSAMARAAAIKGIPFLHISTDYVFGGTGDVAFKPEDAPGPLGAYGRSKLAGEKAVLAAGGNALILRTSWVFSAHGSNFVKTMLRLGHERKTLDVVSDQIGGPTPASAIATALIVAAEHMAAGQEAGIYHFAGQPAVSWADFARAILAEAKLDCTVRDIPTIEYPTPARRPGNSRLDCTSYTEAFGIGCPDWRVELKKIIAEIRI